MTDRELRQFIDHVKSQTGINLDASKRYLLESRLSPVLQKFNLNSYAELWGCVSDDRSIENQALISAITTNETYFFRDEHPFELLKYKLIPDLLGEDQNVVVKIASAACSSGQEAYSMAMVLKEILFNLTDFRVQINAFDISDDIIAAASKGEYTKFEVQRGLSDEKIRSYFDCVNDRYQVKAELRSIISFSKRNLLKPARVVAKFNIIFCRNVVNYFEDKDRALLFDNLAAMLLPRGILVIGATEFLNNQFGHFVKKSYKGSVYYEKAG
ncbi:MAG: protein-glutamate O-methyltransferase CheR [Gammaproteobacteria bacterium]|nr:protein-glutamate O-methyltransferase CheR [Gammaproteobacteria bacterium]MBQ0838706.1 protein-glutamate O-methyltransferase CheR [Gammaproteobacteria bacterium]